MKNLEKIKSFYSFLEKNQKVASFLKSEMKAYKKPNKLFFEEKVIPIAQKNGFDISLQDFINYESYLRSFSNLSDSELENISGGTENAFATKSMAVLILCGGLMMAAANNSPFVSALQSSNASAITSKANINENAPKILEVTSNKIKLETIPDFEYNIAKSDFHNSVPWQKPFQSSGTFENLEDFSTYKITVRNKITSEIITKTPITIRTKISAEHAKPTLVTYNNISIKTPVYRNVECFLIPTDKSKPTLSQTVFEKEINFNNVEDDTEYTFVLKDKTSGEEVSAPTIIKTPKDPYRTKILSVTSNSIKIEPIKGYNYILVEKGKDTLEPKLRRKHEIQPKSGVFSNLESNKKYSLIVSYNAQQDSKTVVHHRIIKVIKTQGPGLSEEQKNSLEKLLNANPQVVKIKSVKSNEIILEDLPPEYKYRLENFELSEITQSSGEFKNLKSSTEYVVTIIPSDLTLRKGYVKCSQPVLIKTKDDPNQKQNQENKIPMLLFSTYNKIVLQTVPGFEYRISEQKPADAKYNYREAPKKLYKSKWQDSGILEINGKEDPPTENGKHYTVDVRNKKTGLIVNSFRVFIDDSYKEKPELLAQAYNTAVVKTLPGHKYELVKASAAHRVIKTQDSGTFKDLKPNKAYIIKAYKMEGNKKIPAGEFHVYIPAEYKN